MTLQKEIVVLTKDEALFETLRPVVEGHEGGISQAVMCRDMISLTGRLESRQVPFVLIEGDTNLNGLLEEIEPIANRFVHSRFILVTSILSSDLVLKAMQCGVRHVQMKSTVESELPDVLERLQPESNPQDSRPGKVITILSAGGGCGATTLVVNLANELQLTSSKPVLLIDMDFHYGAVATYLELHGQYGIADVLAHKGNVDANLIDTTAVEYSEYLHALISPASIDFREPPAIDPEQLANVLSACKQGHAYTLVDAPRVSMDTATALAENSDTTLLVCQPMVKDIRIAKAMLAGLMERGIPMDRIRPILNRYKKHREMVSYDEAKKALGDIPLGRMANDYASAVRGVNFGKPLASSAPRSALRKDFRHLADEMTVMEAPVNGHSDLD